MSKFVLYILSGGLHACAKSVGWHSHAPAVFNMIASGEVQLFIVQPPGTVDMGPAYAIFIIAVTTVHQMGQHGTSAGAGRVMEVSAQNATTIGQAVGMGFGLGIHRSEEHTSE